jgi:hypothetical protein
MYLLHPMVTAAQTSAPAAPTVPTPSIGALTGPASPTPAPGVRPGWTLAVSQEPSYSVQLPPGWTRDLGAPGIAATSPTGERLGLTVDALPLEADVDAGVAREERDPRSASTVDPATTFRQVGVGVIARIDLGPSADATDGSTTSRFIYPSCADGTRTLQVTGPSPVPGDSGQPDAWDRIASGVDPCATGPAPQRILDAEHRAAAATYYALATAANRAIDEAYLPLTRITTLKVWHTQARVIGKVERGLIADLRASVWPPSVRPLVDALIARHEDAARMWGVTFAKAKGPKVISSRFHDLERISGAIEAAGRDLRFALGLPTHAR